MSGDEGAIKNAAIPVVDRSEDNPAYDTGASGTVDRDCDGNSPFGHEGRPSDLNGIREVIHSLSSTDITPDTLTVNPSDSQYLADKETPDRAGDGSDYRVVERYWVYEPYAYINILYGGSDLEYLYELHEPQLTDFEAELLEMLYEDLKDVLVRSEVEAGKVDRVKLLRSKCDILLSVYGIKLDRASLQNIYYYIERNYVGYGKIDALMRDRQIEDISCNGQGVPIYLFHQKYQNVKTNITYEKEDELNSAVVRLAQRGGKHISIASPISSATLPDGSRIEATLGREVTTRGSSFSIRKFKPDPFTPIDLIRYNTMPADILAYLWIAIENNKNLIFAGGTASGKTSSLNSISLFIPKNSKVITIEDTRELTLYNSNWIAGVTRNAPSESMSGEIGMFDLLKAALRQRPEYIIVGEVRGKEALTLFQAMNTGHTTYSTMHAGSIQGVVNRLLNDPINVPNMMLQSLNIVSIQELVVSEGRRVRRCKGIVEITGVDPKTNNLRINEIYRWNSVSDTYDRLGDSYILNDIMAKRGWDRAMMAKELENRAKVLQYLYCENIRDYRSVGMAVHLYSVMSQRLLELIDRGELKDTLKAGVKR